MQAGGADRHIKCPVKFCPTFFHQPGAPETAPPPLSSLHTSEVHSLGSLPGEEPHSEMPGITARGGVKPEAQRLFPSQVPQTLPSRLVLEKVSEENRLPP